METEKQSYSYRIDLEHLFTDRLSNFAVIYNDDPHFLGKHGSEFRPATKLEAMMSHSANGCRLTVGHYNYGEATCHFCGKIHYAYGMKPDGN